MKKAPVIWLILWFGAALAAMATSSSDHDLPNALRQPGWPHLFGFDAFGRDLLFGVLRASLASSAFALGAVVVSLALGLSGGLLITLGSRPARFGLERALDLLLAFPSLLFALAWAAVHGPGWDTLALALLLGTAPPLTRLVQTRSRELLSQEYVLAARSLGASNSRIATRHLTPALLSLCSVKAPNLFAQALMAEATLSFLGIGAPVGRETWGSLLAQGKDYLIEAPHMAIAAGIPLALTILSLQLLTEE